MSIEHENIHLTTMYNKIIHSSFSLKFQLCFNLVFKWHIHELKKEVLIAPIDVSDVYIICLSTKMIYHYKSKYIYMVDVVEWSRALDVRLSEWCCNVSMVWVQIPSREEQNLTALKSNSNTVWFNFQTYIYISRDSND
jgi:hypothetical protein